MNTELINKWLSSIRGSRNPPGCADFSVKYDKLNEYGRVGIVWEHRFAFYYWTQYYIATKNKNKNCRRFPCPTLITIDYHNDVVDSVSEYRDELKALDLSNDIELLMFCWSRLNPLNDDHIVPALYKNIFQNVYVLSKTFRPPKVSEITDYEGNKHQLKYFKTTRKLIESLLNDGYTHIFLDIDLDYFTSKHNENCSPSKIKLIGKKYIRSFLSRNGNLMSKIRSDLVGITIALEPEWCGGFENSLLAFNLLNKELFNSTLGKGYICEWKM